MNEIISSVLTFFVAAASTLLLLIYRRKLKYPQQSYFLCFLNVVLTPWRMLFWKKFDIDAAIRDAKKRHKTEKFGENEESYRYMTTWLQNTETFKSLQYSNMGYIMSQMESKLMMDRRIKFSKYIEEHPEITKIPVEAPVFVMGLGRSGTTFLHRLLSLDPAVRSPFMWECLNGVPTKVNMGMDDPAAMAKDRQKRMLLMKKNLKARDWMGDKSLEHIHEVSYDLPEECLFFLSNDLPFTFNFLYALFIEADEFFNERNDKHFEIAFKMHQKYLQMLTYQGEAVHGEEKESTSPDGAKKRWVLKCPLHLWMVKHIKKQYPDAKFVWAHRHPVKNFSSICGLIQAMSSMYFEKECTNEKKLGKEMFKLVGRILKEAPEQIQQTGLSCANVVFDDLVKDPIKTVEKIYDQFGYTVSDEYRKIMEDYVKANAAKREKSSALGKGMGQWHTLEGFGVKEEDLRKGNYAEYVKAFNIPEKGK